MIKNAKSFLSTRKEVRQWTPFSKLLIKSDGSSWVLNSIKIEMEKICDEIGIDILNDKYESALKKQCIFYTSKYDVLSKKINSKNKIAFPYFHGDPNTDPVFKKLIFNLEKNHEKISRIQVSHSTMESIILDTGIDKSKVFKIPISIDLESFPVVDLGKRLNSRKKLNIPEQSFVIGSFQKDGVGWGKGSKPKLIKGPDIFLKTIHLLKDSIPNLHILLTGPSRGYVIDGLEKMDISYSHYILNNYSNIYNYYHALDCYIISAREEGGPRSVLESMACGIPLVSTPVGQAVDLINHEINGWLVENEDVDGLAFWTKTVFENSLLLDQMKSAKRLTAEQNCYQAQIPLWEKFFNGFIDQ